ncbi:MAG: hypothetical protein QOH48_1911, partial [Actinomycetota bacterium]|nr:hypothetical protein [Actinomycetota bacterium]
VVLRAVALPPLRAAALRAVVLRAVALPPLRAAALRAVVLRAVALPPLRAAALRAVVLRPVVLRVPVDLRAVVLRAVDLRVVDLRRVPVAFRVPVDLRAVVLRVPVDLLAPVERVVDRFRPVVFFTAKAHTSISCDRREIFSSLRCFLTKCAWNKRTFTFIRHDLYAACKHLSKNQQPYVYLPLIVSTRLRRRRGAQSSLTKQLASVEGSARDAVSAARARTYHPRYRTAPCCSTRTRDTSFSLRISNTPHVPTLTSPRVRERRSPDRLRDNARCFATRRAATASW